VQVTSAVQAAARDGAAIAERGGSFPLMLTAGTVAAASIARSAAGALARGVDVFVGGGNNGGDGYVVAAQLARLGVRVRVHVVVPPSSPDCTQAAAIARARLPQQDIVPFVADGPPPVVAGAVVVDAMLGMGGTGALRPAFAVAAACIDRARRNGAVVVALDVPTGVDATSGARAHGHVQAHVTLTFGTCKSGLLSARAACGRVQVLDIGLGVHAQSFDGAPQLATAETLRVALPPIAWNAHKGTRGRVLLVGGTGGMAGAVQLAAQGALFSGAGLVRAAVHERSIAALQSSVPAVVTVPWGDDDDAVHADLDETLAVSLTETPASPLRSLREAASDWAHAVAIGPGLGRDARASRLFARLLSHVSAGRAALVLDADALVLLAERGLSPEFVSCAATRPVVITPHAGEFATLAQHFAVPFDHRASADPTARLESARALARVLQCVVLLKGAPTMCVSPEGAAWFVARGSAALATGGTGDLLTGVLASVLAAEQARTVMASAAMDSAGIAEARMGSAGVEPNTSRTLAQVALSAWVHGVAGEFGGATIRGRTVMDVIGQIPSAWARVAVPEAHAPGVLAELPALEP